MRWKYLLSLLILAALLGTLLGAVTVARAQDWSYTVGREEADVWIERDGSVRLQYSFTFTCDVGAHAIDAIDLGLPTSDYSISGITANVDGLPIDRVDTDFRGEGPYGVAVWLGNATIAPGQTRTVNVSVDRVGGMVYEARDDRNYASTEFIPNYFGSGVHGTTDMTVRFHLPLGVQPNDPRWHASPSGWPAEPASYHDDQERIVYEWTNSSASPSQAYTFGASFPRQYVDEGAIQKGPSVLQQIWSTVSKVICNPVFLVIAFVLLVAFLSTRAKAGQRMAYLPPSMKVEGVGIKRGLTAVEAAIVLETPLNKILTMILFGLLKKGAVTVLEDNPLKIQPTEPQPADLNPYEKDFLAAAKADGTLDEEKLRKAMIELVKSVNNKMKGFSRKETVTYYRDIVQRAWKQVDGAETPEVRGQLFGEGLEWTMLDQDFKDHTERTFREGPVFVPVWWGGYRPWAHTLPSGGATAGPVSVPTAGVPAAPIHLPTLPGANFAATIVRGVEGTASSIVRNITGFTGGVTKVTNPAPVSTSSGRSGGWTSSGGSGGHSCACACACACAGCACACAGGGR